MYRGGWSIVIYILINSCQSFDLNVAKKVINRLADQEGITCLTLMDSQHFGNWSEKRQTYLLSKMLTMDRRPISISFFERFSTKKSNGCKPLFIFLASDLNVKTKLTQFSNEISMSECVWLIFLDQDFKVEMFLREINAPFDSKIIVAKIIGSDYVSFQEVYKIDQKFDLRVISYGFWSEKKFEAPKHASVFSRRNDLQGLPVRASTKPDFPLCSTIQTKQGKFLITGYLGDIYYELSRRVNFTPVYVPARKNVTGASIDGTWDGLLGMIQKDEIDLSVGPQALDVKVLSVASYLRPLFATSFTIFYKERRNDQLEWDAIFKPFGFHVWLSIIAWVGISSFVLNKLYKVECKLGKEDEIYKTEYNLINSFFLFVKALAQQGDYLQPKSLPCRIVFLTAYLISSLLLTEYSASLISNLTFQRPNRPFDSLQTFLKEGSYRLIAIGSSTDYLYFSEASDDLRKNIYEKTMKSAPESKLVYDKEAGMKIVCEKEKYAFFITLDIPAITAMEISEDETKNCKILHLENRLDKVFLTIVRRKNLSYAGLLDREILKMETSGILKNIKRRHWPLEKAKTVNNAKHFQKVTIEQVVQIYIILISGIALSTFILIFEIITYDRLCK